jgi:phosphatidylserine/phosphatidylglycerophosphate/cardiolipin synthase-like enzyme
VQPYAAWTGSFNFTLNAASSLENAVILREPTLVNAYYEEWAQVLAVSEPLDWTADWVEPDWRIGS